jgi:hypothetical protein
MSSVRLLALALALLAPLATAGLLVAGCGGDDAQAEGAATQKAAIQAYCDANGIDIPELNVSGDDGFGDKPTVSVEDPDWEIDYAFPAAQEGTGRFFLLHKTDTGWTVVAHTGEGRTGWTADELNDLGAPADLAEQPVQ